jgi:hypothetical protein
MSVGQSVGQNYLLLVAAMSVDQISLNEVSLAQITASQNSVNQIVFDQKA